MSYRFYGGLNRTICSVFQEMRDLDKTKNYSSLRSLIEEAQSMANRMEAALSDIGDIEDMRLEKKKLKNELKKLDKKKETKE